jgi:hypothetical protein
MRVSQFLGIESADPLRLRSGVAGESVSVEDNATACQARCFRTGCFKGVLLFPICLSLLDHVWVPFFCFSFLMAVQTLFYITSGRIWWLDTGHPRKGDISCLSGVNW